VSNFPLKLEGGPLAEETNGNNDLVFPKRNSVEDRRLNLLNEYLIVLLNQPNLRAGLDRNHPGKLHVVEFLLETIDGGVQVLQFLGVDWVVRLRRPLLEFRDHGRSNFL